jgi:hypothetical protein
MERTVAWWRRWSRIAAATVVSSKIAPQCGDVAVGGEDDRAVLVAAGDDLEEVRGGFGGHR